MSIDREREETRIRAVYAQRDRSGKRALSALERPENFWRARREQVARTLLADAGYGDLSSAEVLDVGCGAGDWLRTLCAWGADEGKLHGIDLLGDRIEAARAAAPVIDFRIGSGWALPFERGSMDLVCANTVFSSIPDPDARDVLAGEIGRVMKPDGWALIYDFRVSHPRNPDTVGIGRSEVRRLFPSLGARTRSLTLAPPIARPLTRVSVGLARLVEAGAPFLRTHAVHLLGIPLPSTVP